MQRFGFWINPEILCKGLVFELIQRFLCKGLVFESTYNLSKGL